jgi:hypothetical protein
MAKQKKGKNNGTANRRKGHAFERLLAAFFRQILGFQFCKTSRQSSRLMDDCGVDLTGLPFLIQAKRGYNKNRPKYEAVYESIKSKLRENYPEDDIVHDKPIVLIHKMDGGKKQHFQWVFAHEDIAAILKELVELREYVQKGRDTN